MCCHTGMPCCRHRTWHPTPSQYTDTGPTCRCAIHWCGTSHLNTQLPLLLSWVWPDREILPWPSTHTSECSTLWYWYGGSQSEAWWKVSYQPGLEPGTCGVRIHYTIRSPTAASYPALKWLHPAKKDLHAKGKGLQLRGYSTLSTKLLIECHHVSIEEEHLLSPRH